MEEYECPKCGRDLTTPLGDGVNQYCLECGYTWGVNSLTSGYDTITECIKKKYVTSRRTAWNRIKRFDIKTKK